MTPTFRTITSGVIEWHGILIAVTHEPQRWVDHLQIETLEPKRGPLPITETGYLSHFFSKEVIEKAGGPAAYVQAWLEQSTTKKGWPEIEAAVRQYSLF